MAKERLHIPVVSYDLMGRITQQLLIHETVRDQFEALFPDPNHVKNADLARFLKANKNKIYPHDRFNQGEIVPARVVESRRPHDKSAKPDYYVSSIDYCQNGKLKSPTMLNGKNKWDETYHMPVGARTSYYPDGSICTVRHYTNGQKNLPCNGAGQNVINSVTGTGYPSYLHFMEGCLYPCKMEDYQDGVLSSLYPEAEIKEYNTKMRAYHAQSSGRIITRPQSPAWHHEAKPVARTSKTRFAPDKKIPA